MARAAPESRQQARTIAYSLARALRALAGDLSWERLGRIALLENASEILPKSPGPRLILGLLLGLLGLTLGLLARSWGSPGAPGALPGASGEPLETSKIAPGGPPGGLPRRSSIWRSFWGPFWLHVWTPRTSKISVFVWKDCIFREHREVRKSTPQNRNLAIMEREAREAR